MNQSSTKKAVLRVVVIAQSDSFVIPENILKLERCGFVSVTHVVKVVSSGAVESKAWLFFRGFGFFQFLKLAVLRFSRGILDLVDRGALWRLNKCFSLPSAARKSKAHYLSVDDPNSDDFVKFILSEQTDLIVSYSAPVIFKAALLSAPALGCINLHCSLLPKFAGLLPSFWVLHEGSSSIGATVHRMDSKIDNGEILGQVTLPMPSKASMYEVIKITKSLGGDLMISTIWALLNGTCVPRENHVGSGDYRSWPTLNDIREFRKAGGRLI